MNASTTTRREDQSRQTACRLSNRLLLGTSGIAVMLLLSMQLGCGNPSSASSQAKVESQTVPAVEPDVAVPTKPESEVPAAEVNSTNPETESPAASDPTVESPASQPAVAAEPQVAEENAGSNVRPDGVELVKAEQAAKPAEKPNPATETAGATADQERTRNYSFDDLKFDIEKDAPFERSMLPKKIEGYAGQRVSIRGFILPTSFQTGLTNFVLVRDNMECCFGPGAALYDCIVVEMAEGKTTDYSIRPVTVEGKFAIEEFIGPGRRHLAIYKIVADKVE